jgi:spore maturation protein CgeB
MKIFIIHHYYLDFLKEFYRKNSGAKNLSYEEQKALMVKEQFGTSNFYSKNLAPLGHIAEEFVINCEAMQKQWAKENGVKLSWFKSNWMEQILEAQIKEFKPDVVYSHNLKALSLECLDRIKKMTKLLAGQIASPLPEEKYLRKYDLILSSFPHYVEKFKNIGIESEYFNLGFEETILPTLEKTAEQYNTSFVGTLGGKHLAGLELFKFISEHCTLDLWGPKSEITKNYHGEAWGHKMYNILHNSKIVLNRHIGVAENYANNMRLYEATGTGALLITDFKPNLNDLFVVGREVETYKTKEELLEKIEYYLSHEAERKIIAEAGQRRTLKDHTYRSRMVELSAILSKHLNK